MVTFFPLGTLVYWWQKTLSFIIPMLKWTSFSDTFWNSFSSIAFFLVHCFSKVLRLGAFWVGKLIVIFYHLNIWSIFLIHTAGVLLVFGISFLKLAHLWCVAILLVGEILSIYHHGGLLLSSGRDGLGLGCLPLL